jgi:hypothetical protein
VVKAILGEGKVYVDYRKRKEPKVTDALSSASLLFFGQATRSRLSNVLCVPGLERAALCCTGWPGGCGGVVAVKRGGRQSVRRTRQTGEEGVVFHGLIPLSVCDGSDLNRFLSCLC